MVAPRFAGRCTIFSAGASPQTPRPLRVRGNLFEPPTGRAMSVSIPGFRVGERVHQSGPRVVYRALREEQGDEVILKTLAARYPAKHELAEIRREFRIAQGLQSVSGVIRVH